MNPQTAHLAHRPQPTTGRREAPGGYMRLAELSRRVSVDADQRVPLGEDAATLVWIESGATKLVAHASADRHQIVAFQFARDLMIVPPAEDHTYSLCTLVDCELLVLEYGRALSAAADEPALMLLLLEGAVRSLARCREKAILLGRKTAPERLASFLLSMADRIGVSEGDAIALDLPMSRRDIADSLGLTIETVSRQLTQLRDEAILSTSGRSIVRLLDLPALRTRCGFLPA